MADVKWIKIVTDIFDDEKILLIETLPEADSIIVIWFKLLCLAGKQNNSGVFMLNDRMPYNERMFATIFRRKETTIQLALKTFEEFEMIEILDGAVTIPNWGKHQNLESMERRKNYMKEYMKEYRTKQAQLLPLPADESEESSVSWSDLKEAFNNECAYCGRSEDVAGTLQQEHIIPFNCDGEYALGNIIPACKSCNASKGKKNMDEWYAQQDFFSEERLNKIIQYAENPENFISKHLRKHLRKQDVSLADKNKNKNKNKNKEPPYPLTEFDFSNPLQEKVQEWLTYKTEKKDTYKPTGFKSLMLKIQKQAAEYGDQAVMDLIDECMAANWKGIVWDKLQQRKNDRSGNPFKEALRKELEREQNRSNSNDDGYQGGLSKLLQEPGRGQ